MKLFIDNGVQGTPMSAIAKAADTGMGTIYNYFTTKEDLINAIYLYIKQDEHKWLKLPFTDEPVKRRFDHYFRTLILYFVKHPVHFGFMDQFHNSPILTPETKADGLKTIEPLIVLMTMGQEQGILKQIDFYELLYFINGGLMGFIRWVLREAVPLNQAMLDNQLRIAWDAAKE
jgi:AcrR family transcriptional regulator